MHNHISSLCMSPSQGHGGHTGDSNPTQGQPEPGRDQHWGRGAPLPLPVHCPGV